MPREMEGFLCAEAAAFPSELLISHRIKLSCPVDTETKIIRSKTDRMVFSESLNSHCFSVSRVIPFARSVCYKNQREGNYFQQIHEEVSKCHCFLMLRIQVWLQGVSLEAKTTTSSFITISLHQPVSQP